MCIYSMVHDHFYPIIPDIRPAPFVPVVPDDWRPPPPFDLAKIMKDYAEAMAAAKKVDELTGQPDCAVPEKRALEERIRELEALLEKKPEFVLVKGAKLEPGMYRVIDGKLFKVTVEEVL